VGITLVSSSTTNTSNDQDTPSQPSLQEMITHAAPGSTLVINAGIYPEIIDINKPLTLIGDTKETTIIAPTSSLNSYAVRITAEGVHLRDLTIINHGPGLYTTGVKVCAEHTTIERCIVKETPVGIALWSSFNTISTSEFYSCEDEGIVVLGSASAPCSDITISDCLFSGNCDGIELQESRDIQISDCTFIKNTHAGVDAIGSSNQRTSVISCTFQDNTVFGIYLAGGSNAQIHSCTFISSPLMVPENSGTILTDCHYDTGSSPERLVTSYSAPILSSEQPTKTRKDSSYSDQPGNGIRSSTIIQMFFEKIMLRLSGLKNLFILRLTIV